MFNVLGFVNRARDALGLPHLPRLPLAGSVFDSPTDCIVARALDAFVGFGPQHWGYADPWIMCFGDELVAELVADATGQPYDSEGNVLSPLEVVEVAVSFYYGVVLAHETGGLRAWAVPSDDAGAREGWIWRTADGSTLDPAELPAEVHASLPDSAPLMEPTPATAVA